VMVPAGREGTRKEAERKVGVRIRTTRKGGGWEKHYSERGITEGALGKAVRKIHQNKGKAKRGGPKKNKTGGLLIKKKRNKPKKKNQP